MTKQSDHKCICDPMECFAPKPGCFFHGSKVKKSTKKHKKPTPKKVDKGTSVNPLYNGMSGSYGIPHSSGSTWGS